jgi:CubicO group peptidase (beta-lactamase class C family)
MKKVFIFSPIQWVVILAIFSGGLAGLQAQSSKILKEEAVLQLIEEFDNTSTPGGAVMVIRDGQIIYEKSFGMANLTHGIPFEISTPTNLGSTTKQFTAFGIALLEERGLLSVDDDIRKFFLSYPILVILCD